MTEATDVVESSDAEPANSEQQLDEHAVLAANSTEAANVAENIEQETADSEADGNEGEFTITLAEAIDADNVHKLHEELTQIKLNELQKVIIDADDLEDIDFTGMQLLVSFRHQFASTPATLHWENISIPMFQAATETGLCDALGL